MEKRITLYRPGKEFPSVSITGITCGKSCDHCGGKYLKGMVDVSKNGSLLDFGMALYQKGGKGMLISGGCDTSGAVAFRHGTFEEIRELKERTSLKINIHTGLVDESTTKMIKRSGVDKVSFDLIYHDQSIENIFHLKRSREDFVKTLSMMSESGISVSPHILAGLHEGKVTWEYEAVDVLSGQSFEEVVLIVFVPTKGTKMEKVGTPDSDSVIDLGRYMRRKLGSRLLLGCMRPKGSSDIEIGLIEAGFDGIVLPSKRAVSHIIAKGWEIREKRVCCCF
ncbi:MAG: hypothetical protein ACMUIE_02950 [Thermoplasmatota archaeon]